MASLLSKGQWLQKSTSVKIDCMNNQIDLRLIMGKRDIYPVKICQNAASMSTRTEEDLCRREMRGRRMYAK
jgi:hypothetical protein